MQLLYNSFMLFIQNQYFKSTGSKTSTNFRGAQAAEALEKWGHTPRRVESMLLALSAPAFAVLESLLPCKYFCLYTASFYEKVVSVAQLYFIYLGRFGLPLVGA